MAAHDVHFEGLAAPLRTVNCEDIIEGLAGYLPGWPFVVSAPGTAPECALLAFNGSAYMVRSRHTAAPRIHKTPVNAICDILSILASAMIAEEDRLLCFHSAALEIDGGLVLFPAVRRAGKSTLAAALMARGAKLFTDDWLPVPRGEDGRWRGRATGISARLRMPLPEGLPEAVQGYIAAHPGPENRQYRYLPGPEVAPHGRQLPIRSIVLLDREEGATPEVTPVSQEDLLGKLAYQNFSRGVPAGEALSALVDLARSAPAVRLRYDDPGAAAEIVLGGLPRGSAAAPEPVRFPEPGPRLDRAPLETGIAYRRTRFAQLQDAGEVWVGASSDGRQILRFDAAAVGVLDLLEDPLTPAEIVGMIREAFPAADPAEIEANTLGILRNFLKVGYIART